MQMLQMPAPPPQAVQKCDCTLESIRVTYQFGKQCFQFGMFKKKKKKLTKILKKSNSFSCWAKLKELQLP